MYAMIVCCHCYYSSCSRTDHDYEIVNVIESEDAIEVLAIVIFARSSYGFDLDFVIVIDVVRSKMLSMAARAYDRDRDLVHATSNVTANDAAIESESEHDEHHCSLDRDCANDRDLHYQPLG